MYVAAGPPGSGKSTFLRREFFDNADYFNADDRAAQITGSYRSIPTSVRAWVNKEFEQWINTHIEQRKSLAFETTLRSNITFQHARMARDKGFRVYMRYVAVGEEESLKRVANRADAGGHAASERTLLNIHRSSMKNLAAAAGERSIEFLRVYDNSVYGESPRLVLELRRGRPLYVTDQVPAWLESALAGTPHEIGKLRMHLARPRGGLRR
jgi:predicted ABC-type ATPase